MCPFSLLNGFHRLNTLKMSTEDPLPGILRFSQAVSLQPLYFTKLFTEENGTIPQYPPLKSLADSPDGMHPHKQKQPMQEYPLRVQYRQE